MTDGWRGYRRIPRGFRHELSNRHGGNGNHNTNLVEGLWGELRANIRARYYGGVVEGNVEHVLRESLWRRRCNMFQIDTLESLIEILI